MANNQKGWQEVKLRACISKVIDNRGKNPSAYYSSAEYPVIDNFLIKNELHPNLKLVERYIDNRTYQNFLRGYTYSGMVIMTLVGNGIGNVSTIENDKCVIIQNTIGFAVNKHMMYDLFLYYLCLYKQKEIKKFDRGSGQPSIKKTDLLNISIPLPPLEVQKKIAGVLGALDDKIELNNKINQNLEAQAQALFENVILSQPEKGTIGMYCDVKSGFAFKSSWWQNRGIKVIKIKNIENTVLNLNDCSYVSSDKVDCAKDFTVQGGDLLIAMTGATIGKFAIVPYSTETLLVNQRVGKFFLGRNPIEKLPFIYCTLKQPEIYSEIINRGQGSAQANISGSDIMSISCTFPNKKIVDSFNYLTQPIFQKMIFNWYENTRLAELRDNLLPKLMSGEIIIQ